MDIASGAIVADEAVVNAKLCGHHRCARWATGDVGGVAVCKANTFICNAVDVGGCVAVVAVTSEVVGAEGVEVEVDNFHFFGLAWLIVFGGPFDGLGWAGFLTTAIGNVKAADHFFHQLT